MMTSTTNETPTSQVTVGERVELGRYRTAAGDERVLYSQPIATESE
jgi:hypothetical protein